MNSTIGLNSSSTTPVVHVTVVSDVVCPFCYIGLRNLQRASETTNIPIQLEWEPFLLNINNGSPKDIPENGMPLIQHLADKYGPTVAKSALDPNSSIMRSGRAVGIEFKNDRYCFPTVKAHVLMDYIKENINNDTANVVMEELFQRYFVRGDNINDTTILHEISTKVGLVINKEDLEHILMDENRKNKIRQKDNNFKTKMRVSGVPYFIFTPSPHIKHGSNVSSQRQQRPIFVSGAQPPDIMAEALENAVE
jgi:predicted DsbA family dithiol-disulfide isomerase